MIAGDQLKVQWFKDGVLLIPSHDYDIKAEGEKQILILPQGKPQDSGYYVCQADSPFGKATCSAQLTVQPISKPVTTQPSPVVPWKTEKDHPKQESFTEHHETITTAHIKVRQVTLEKSNKVSCCVSMEALRVSWFLRVSYE